MSSINLQTPIIYPSVVFFSIRIVTVSNLFVAFDTDAPIAEHEAKLPFLHSDLHVWVVI